LTTWAILLNTIDHHLFPSTSFDISRRNAYAEAEPLFMHHFTSRPPHYLLEYLGVLPTAQNQGHGRKLVEWGLTLASKESVPAAVVCSAGSEEFYKKCGFTEEVGSVTTGEGNPLSEVEGGAILFCNV
jgi:GNAT superfamily N-acetyltransferase